MTPKGRNIPVRRVMSSRANTLLCKDRKRVSGDSCPECGLLLFVNKEGKTCANCHYPDTEATGRGQHRGLRFELPQEQQVGTKV